MPYNLPFFFKFVSILFVFKLSHPSLHLGQCFNINLSFSILQTIESVSEKKMKSGVHIKITLAVKVINYISFNPCFESTKQANIWGTSKMFTTRVQTAKHLWSFIPCFLLGSCCCSSCLKLLQLLLHLLNIFF